MNRETVSRGDAEDAEKRSSAISAAPRETGSPFSITSEHVLISSSPEMVSSERVLISSSLETVSSERILFFESTRNYSSATRKITSCFQFPMICTQVLL